MVGSTKVLSVVYIRTSHLTKHSYNCFEGYTILTKTTIMKQVIEEKKVFRSEIMTRKKRLTMKFKYVFLLLKMNSKVSLKNIYRKEAKRKICIGCMLMDLNYCLLWILWKNLKSLWTKFQKTWHILLPISYYNGFHQ